MKEDEVRRELESRLSEAVDPFVFSVSTRAVLERMVEEARASVEGLLGPGVQVECDELARVPWWALLARWRQRRNIRRGNVHVKVRFVAPLDRETPVTIRRVP